MRTSVTSRLNDLYYRQPAAQQPDASATSAGSVKAKLLAVLQPMGQAILWMLADHNEPRIRQVRDRAGATYWRAYDPTTEDLALLRSEAEVRFWLEQRYRR